MKGSKLNDILGDRYLVRKIADSPAPRRRTSRTSGVPRSGRPAPGSSTKARPSGPEGRR